MPVPLAAVETVEVVLTPTERRQRRTVDAPRMQVFEETVEALTLVPRERVQHRPAGQIVHVPPFREETVGALTVTQVIAKTDGTVAFCQKEQVDDDIHKIHSVGQHQ